MLDNCFFRKIADIDEKIKRLIISASCFLLIMFELTPIIALRRGGLDTILSFLLCFAIIAMSYDGQIRFQKGKRFIFIAALILGVAELVSGVMLGVLGYMSYGMFYVIVPTGLILVVNSKKQIERLMYASSQAMALSFAVLFVLSVFFSPLGSEQYESILGNPNALGMYACIGFLGSLYLSVTEKKYRYYVLLGLSFGFIYFSRSRTSLLLVIGSAAVLLFYVILNRREQKVQFKNVVKCLVTVAASVFISFAGISYVNSLVGITNLDTIEKIEAVFDVNIIKTDDDDKPEFSDVLASGIDRSLKGIADDNSFTSGRTAIWVAFLNNIDIGGHASGVIELEGADYNAHNAFIQVAYSYGIVSGILYLIIALYMLVVIISQFVKSLKRKHISFEKCFAAIIYGSFMVYSTLSAAVSPFSYFIIMEVSLCVLPYIGTDFWSHKSDLLGAKGV